MEPLYSRMQILTLGLIITVAFVGGRITRRLKLGETTGQIIGGVLIGPHIASIIGLFFSSHPGLRQYGALTPIYFTLDNRIDLYSLIVNRFHFIVYLYAIVLVFSLSFALKQIDLLKTDKRLVMITLSQNIATFLIVFIGIKFTGLSSLTALVIAAIATATAQGTTLLLIDKAQMENSYRLIASRMLIINSLFNIILFSLLISIIVLVKQDSSIGETLLRTGLDAVVATLLGGLIYLTFKVVLRGKLRSNAQVNSSATAGTTPEIILFLFGLAALIIGVGLYRQMPFLFTAVVFALLVSKDESLNSLVTVKLYKILHFLNPLIFGIIGASLPLADYSLYLIPVLLLVAGLRFVGKFFVTSASIRLLMPEPKLAATLPLVILPMSGLAAAQAVIAMEVIGAIESSEIMLIVIPLIMIFDMFGSNSTIKALDRWKSWTVTDTLPSAEATLSLSDMLRVHKLTAHSRETAIFELAQLFVKDEVIQQAIEVSKPVMEREQLSSTAVGNGFALPHCRLPDINRPLIALGWSEKPFQWNNPDEQIDVIFLLISPTQDVELHLSTMKMLGKFLSGEQAMNNLRNSLNEDTIDQFIIEIDSKIRPD
ncbi:MAG: PTS sugar transporter subunit IIA [Candidatus Cloacimonetes bacterium]|nr:PTS sugar transporter subunit IIA [Candidatus Cloacimonadota bacterium]